MNKDKKQKTRIKSLYKGYLIDQSIEIFLKI